MKKTIAILLIVFMVSTMFISCAENKVITINGSNTVVPYYGLGNQDLKRQDVNYQLSGWNIFLAVIFVETIFVPIIIVANQLYEPVAQK